MDGLEIRVPGESGSGVKRGWWPVMVLGLVTVFLFGFLVKFTPTGEQVKQSVSEVKPTGVSLPSPPVQVEATPLPIVATPDERITDAVVNKDCQIQVTTNKGQQFYVPTEYGGVGAKTLCRSSQAGKISPSGRYLAYADSSGGIDALFAIFAVAYGKSFTLGVWGTSTVMDYMFLPDDRLTVINGYPDMYDEQNLMLFNIPEIFKDYGDNFTSDNLYLLTKNPTLDPWMMLPDTGTNHSKISYKDGMLQTRSKEGRLLVQYKVEDMEMNGSVFGVSANMAMSLVYQTEMKYVKPQRSWELAQAVDTKNSTRETWVVAVVDKKTNTEVRRYKVDAKTGEVTKLTAEAD